MQYGLVMQTSNGTRPPERRREKPMNRVIATSCRCETGNSDACNCAPCEIEKTLCNGREHYEITCSLEGGAENIRPCDCTVSEIMKIPLGEFVKGMYERKINPLPILRQVFPGRNWRFLRLTEPGCWPELVSGKAGWITG